MEHEPRIWIYTRAYNAEKTIRRAIESVLNQSYHDFKYLIRDNGSTDKTYEICKEYSDVDERIVLVRNKKNNIFESEEDKNAQEWEGKVWFRNHDEYNYLCILDADDEYCSNFLNDALNLADKENLDVVIGGTEFIEEKSHNTCRIVNHNEQIILKTKDDFSNCFIEYHWHLRQVWGKLFRRKIFHNYSDYIASLDDMFFLGARKAVSKYGSDTIIGLYMFSNTNRIGILPGVYHKYYIQEKSVSTSYYPERIESDWVLHQATEEYLKNKCGIISNQNKCFLIEVYANAVLDSINVITNAPISSIEKINEIKRIAENTITNEMLRYDSKTILNCRIYAMSTAFKCFATDNDQYDTLLCIANIFVPYCSFILDKEIVFLIAGNDRLLRAFVRNDIDEILGIVIDMIKKNENCKKYDLCAIVSSIVQSSSILNKIVEKKFIKKYGEIIIKVWQKQYSLALDNMTDLLINESSGVEEKFLWLYTTLAAMLQKTDEFLFGKLRFAQYYLNNKEYDKCKSELKDLEEMGVEDNEEILRIKGKLELK